LKKDKAKEKEEKENLHYLMEQKKIIWFTSLLLICKHNTLDTLPFVKMKERKTQFREW